MKSVRHASEVLSAFRASGEALPLREVCARSGLPKSMAFRLLYTLERCGMVEKVGENLYRSYAAAVQTEALSPRLRRAGHRLQFSKEISTGLQRAAAAEGIELICVDNRYSPKIAQRNADVLVREKVDLVIEFQTDEHVAPIVAAKYREANIPLIAIEIPHPGRHLLRRQQLRGGPDRRPLPRPLGEAAVAGRGRRDRADHARTRRQPAADAADRHARRHARGLPGARERAASPIVDGDGKLADTFEAMRRHLRTHASRAGCSSAPSTIRARSARCARFRKPAAPSRARSWGRTRRPKGAPNCASAGTRLIGSVAYFPEKYGAEIVTVALDILHRRPVPPAVFVKHQLVTPENVESHLSERRADAAARELGRS